MSLLRPIVLLLALAALGVAPAWAQRRGAVPAGPPRVVEPDAPRLGFTSPSMNAAWNRPDAGMQPGVNPCRGALQLDAGERVLAIQPLEGNGQVQCRVKVMRPDGMVGVRIITP